MFQTGPATWRWSADRFGTHRDYHTRYAEGYRRLDRFRIRSAAARPPEDEDVDELLAIRTIDFFNDAQLLFGVISDGCTAESCPIACAGRRYEYRWVSGQPLAAPRYFSLLFDWVQEQVDDPGLFPTQIGQPRSCSSREFHARLQTIFKRLFRVFAHIYYEHFERVSELGAEPHLNSVFKDFVSFVLEHNLIPERAQLQPLMPLILSLCSDEWSRHLQRHVNRRWSRVRRVAPKVGGFGAVLQELYTEVHYRPGHQGAELAREHFATTAAVADLLSRGKSNQAHADTLCQGCECAG